MPKLKTSAWASGSLDFQKLQDVMTLIIITEIYKRRTAKHYDPNHLI